MKKSLSILICVGLLVSCGHTKYTYHFEEGKNIDFSSGKWILNDPIRNYKNDRINYIASKEFKEILKDSLFEIGELRKDKLISSKFPFEPNENNLKDLKTSTNCDYLINIKSIIIYDQMGSFANSPNVGITTKTNQAESTIRIYNLNTLTLISESVVIGKAELTKRSEDESWDYVHNGTTISMHSLYKLIRKYDKNRIRTK